MSAAYLKQAEADAIETPDLTAQRRKALATIAAELALRGYALQQLADGSWLVQKWGLSSRPLHGIEAVVQFARSVGAPA